MASNFPTSLDTLTNPSAGSSTTTVSHADQHANANDAIEALQAKVGIDSSSNADSLDYKMANHTHLLAGVTDITATATELNYVDGVTSAIQTQLDTKALDSAVVHNTGTETIAGAKTFTSDVVVPEEAYSASWNGSLEVPTKNAVYDRIEAVQLGQVDWGDIVGTLADQTDLQTALDAKQDTLTGLTATVTELNYTDGVTSAIQTQLDGKVNDTGDETIAGVKTFSSDPIIPDEAYGIGWNGSLEPATKNAIYDKIETLNSAEWGNITGTLSSQTDLQTALDAKLSLSGGTLTGNVIANDSVKALFGTGSDASIYYDGTNLVVNPREVGTGEVNIKGSVILDDDYDVTADYLYASTEIGSDSYGSYSGVVPYHSAGIRLRSAPVNQGSGGIVAQFTAGEALVYGDICYINSSGNMVKADADAIATGYGVAMALATIASTATGNFLMSGFARDDTWAWTVGSPIYLSTTAGAMTQTAPSGTDDVVQVLGIATHADRMWFNPQLTVVEVE